MGGYHIFTANEVATFQGSESMEMAFWTNQSVHIIVDGRISVEGRVPLYTGTEGYPWNEAIN